MTSIKYFKLMYQKDIKYKVFNHKVRGKLILNLPDIQGKFICRKIVKADRIIPLNSGDGNLEE